MRSGPERKGWKERTREIILACVEDFTRYGGELGRVHDADDLKRH